MSSSIESSTSSSSSSWNDEENLFVEHVVFQDRWLFETPPPRSSYKSASMRKANPKGAQRSKRSVCLAPRGQDEQKRYRASVGNQHAPITNIMVPDLPDYSPPIKGRKLQFKTPSLRPRSKLVGTLRRPSSPEPFY